MHCFKPLALSLSLALMFTASAQAERQAFNQSAGVDQGMAVGLDMMLLNASVLRNGDNVWARAREGFQMQEVNSDIVRKQEQFYARKPEYLRRTLDRSRKYLFHILNEVERRGMPTEIAFLPLVESAYVPTARSPVGAAGLWQFMPATGRQYGLEQTWWYDGRRDVTEATRAALDYLERLYAQFGDWNLALASYNWGEGNVGRSVARTQAAGQEANYETIRMPNETRNYVPKLLAIRNIIQNPESFGLRLDKLPNQPYFVGVTTGKHMDIDLAAKLAGMSVNEFKELNPAFNLPVYAHKSGRQMLLPVNKIDTFQANLSKWSQPLLTWEVYTPQSDLNVAELASEYGMSSGQLLAANNLSSGTLKAGQPVLVAMNGKKPANTTSDIIDPDYSTTVIAQAQPTRQTVTINPIKTVSSPAKTDNTPAPVLVAAAKPAPATVVTTSMAKPLNQEGNHTVIPGDTLYSIARTYNVSMDDIKALNNLNEENVVKVGQVLNLKNTGSLLADSSKRNDAQADALRKVNDLRSTSNTKNTTEYVVQAGDTVFSIARRFGVKHNDLQRWNDSNQLLRLQPGQRVLIQGL